MLNYNIPRFMLVGSNSNCGKTTLTCGLLQVLKNRGVNIAAFKTGPDYIDPMFHKHILEKDCYNLDSFLHSETVLKHLFYKNSHLSQLAVLEGVMGLYDGGGYVEDTFSSNNLALTLKVPEILVVGARGRALSLLAEIYGYLKYKKNNIQGLILNGINEAAFLTFKEKIEKEFKIKALGYLPYKEEFKLESRHLGLVMDWEIKSLNEKLNYLATEIEKTINIKEILNISQKAQAFKISKPPKENKKFKNLKIGLADDEAFCFHYADNLAYLKELGVEIIKFSPIKDETLPKADGLIFPGGYPELFAEKLAHNKKLKDNLKVLLEKGLPTYAEGGGFVYLGKTLKMENKNYEMLGIFNYESTLGKKLESFGYITLTALKNNLMCQKGEIIKAHEYHYCQSSFQGDVFQAEKLNKKSWLVGANYKNVYAGYPQIHFYSNKNFIFNFLKTCQEFKSENKV